MGGRSINSPLQSFPQAPQGQKCVVTLNLPLSRLKRWGTEFETCEQVFKWAFAFYRLSWK